MHSDSKNPGHFTLCLEILGFFHSVLHDVDFLFIHVLAQQPSTEILLVTLQLRPHKRCDVDVFMCYSKHVKLCTFNLTFSKKKVLCLPGNAISISYLAICIEKKITSSIFQSSLISTQLFPFFFISSEILLPKSKYGHTVWQESQLMWLLSCLK